MVLRTTAAELARWLERAGGYWQVHGEASLRHLPQPAPAATLAAAVRQRNDALTILAPDGCPIAEGTVIGDRDLVRAAHDIDGHSVFQLAWVGADGAPTDAWLVAEHIAMTDSAERRLETTQSGTEMIELLRKELATGETRIDERSGSRPKR